MEKIISEIKKELIPFIDPDNRLSKNDKKITTFIKETLTDVDEESFTLKVKDSRYFDGLMFLACDIVKRYPIHITGCSVDDSRMSYDFELD